MRREITTTSKWIQGYPWSLWLQVRGYAKI